MRFNYFDPPVTYWWVKLCRRKSVWRICGRWCLPSLRVYEIDDRSPDTSVGRWRALGMCLHPLRNHRHRQKAYLCLCVCTPYGHTWAGRNQMWHALLSLSPLFCFLLLFPHIFPFSLVRFPPLSKIVRCPMTWTGETLYLPVVSRWFPSLVFKKGCPCFIGQFHFCLALKITTSLNVRRKSYCKYHSLIDLPPYVTIERMRLVRLEVF